MRDLGHDPRRECENVNDHDAVWLEGCKHAVTAITIKFLAIVGDDDQLAAPSRHDGADHGQKRPQGREEPSRLSHGIVLLSGRQASMMQALLFVDMHGWTR